MALYSYMKDVERWLHDSTQKLVNPADIVEWVNRARRVVAERSQSIRMIAPISGSVTTITVNAGGTGYVNPTVAVSPPDFPSGYGDTPNGAQATATATVVAGIITDIQVTYGGSGYFQPAVTITDSVGTGAAATAATSPILATQLGREVYKFSDVPLDTFPGVQSVLTVLSVSFIYSNLQYSIPIYSLSTYQALIKRFPLRFSYVPTFGAQIGQGTNGSLALYPVASQVYQMSWDIVCLPTDLETDQDFEAIPYPWVDAVAFLATAYGFLHLQNLNAANFYMTKFTESMQMFSAAARPGRRVNPYGGF